MASLVDQIFAQAQAGSAQGQGFGEAFAQGRQLRQQGERINLAERQLAAELATLPLRQTLLQQENDLRTLQVQNTLTDRQTFLQATEQLTELNGKLSQALTETTPEDAQREFALFGIEHPAVLTHPGYIQLGKQLDAMRKEADLAEFRLAQAEARMMTAEASKLRAQLSEKDQELAAGRLELARSREERLARTFDANMARWEKAVPPERLALFRERAAAIRNDLTLLGDAAAVDAKLKALAEELGFRAAPGASAAPGTNTPSGFKVRVIKP